jgi:diketogulonate reductase-like aldo/keto reductase
VGCYGTGCRVERRLSCVAVGDQVGWRPSKQPQTLNPQPSTLNPQPSTQVEWCQSKGIAIQAYRALRDGKAFQNPTVLAVAEKHRRSAAQVLGRWCVQKGVIYIPKSVKEERMVENMAVFDWELDSEDMGKLDALTTPENLETFKALYIKCVTRDTPIEGSEEAKQMTRKTFTVE